MANIYPLQVEINEASILRVTKTFKQAYKDIIKEVIATDNFSITHRREVLNNIEEILTDLGTDVQKFLEDELPDYYRQGADDAIRQLNNIGAHVEIGTGFSRIHKNAIFALVDETATAFGDSLTGVKRSADVLLGKVFREQVTQKLATGLISGQAIEQVKKNIKGTLAEQGLTALKDKSGRSWQLDRYAEMLFRTKAVETRNRGMVNRMVENGYDLVQVSSHQGTCDSCSAWEGKILSITGNDKKYPTVAQAEAGGLFHPNCRHAINVLVPSLAKQTRAYDPNTGTLGE